MKSVISTLLVVAASIMGVVADYPASCTSTTYHHLTTTITDTVTSTYCPVCEEGDVYTTTYETVWSAFCPTGLEDKTYTITETCTGAKTTPTSGYIPTGYTAVVSTCDTCGTAPITATLTVCTSSVPTGITAFTGGASSFKSLSLGAFGISAAAGIGAVFFGMLLL